MTTIVPTLPVLRIENTGTLQQKIPFTFGQVFAQGDFKADEPLAGRIDGTALIQLQVDVKATHADGSVRHAIISGFIPALASTTTTTLQLVKEAVPPSNAAPMAVMRKVSVAAPSVVITLDGVAYTAKMSDGVAKGLDSWLSGPIVQEWHVESLFVNAAGVAHSQLTARFAGRSYGDGSHSLVEVAIENAKTFTPGAQNFTYDASVQLSGVEVFSQVALTHFHHSRWRHVAWVDAANAPSLHIQQDVPYVIASKAIPNYDLTTKPSEATLAWWFANIRHPNSGTVGGVGPMKIGPVNPAMPATGGRPDIAPLPGWTVCYLLSMDKRAKAVTEAAAEGAAAWPIHYRDEKTGYPVRLDNDVNKNISTHMNMAGRGPLPVPRYAGEPHLVAKTPHTPDTAHQPSLVYLPYLITGEYYYLEELHFWAAWNPTMTAASNRGFELGLFRWQELRGQSWSMRTLGHAAYITPDDHPLKGYFNKMLDNNLDYYHKMFVEANPNELGVYDGSGPGSFPTAQGSAPWQDDYFTWSMGNLVELGFKKAEPILHWKSKFMVLRLTSADYCRIHANDYWLQVRDNATSPVYKTIGEVYRANYGSDAINPLDTGIAMKHPQGLRYIDQPMYSQAQWDWIKAASGRPWNPGEWFGYATSVAGYASNMQPGLAVIATLGAQGADEAWEVFAARPVKPDYRNGPQFNIIPRPKPVAPPPPVVVEPPKEPETPPVVVTPPKEEPPVVVTPPPKEEPPVVVVPPVEPPKEVPFVPSARMKLEEAIQRYGAAPDGQVITYRDAAIVALTAVMDAERAKQRS